MVDCAHTKATYLARTDTADITLEDHLIVVRIDADVAQTPENARANLEAAVALCAGRHLPILVDISRCLPLSSAAREVFSGELIEAFCAIALLVEASPLGRMMGNAYLRIVQPGPRTQLFTSEAAAIEWLRERADEAVSLRR